MELKLVLPALNAVLNAISATLLVIGYRWVRRGDFDRHRRAMLAAAVSSTLFLISYLTSKFLFGTTYFGGQGLIRTVYLLILGSHTILAAVIAPLVVLTLWRAFTNQFEAHRRVARWTYPAWLYVSVTGVLVYLMLRPYYAGS